MENVDRKLLICMNKVDPNHGLKENGRDAEHTAAAQNGIIPNDPLICSVDLVTSKYFLMKRF